MNRRSFLSALFPLAISMSLKPADKETKELMRAIQMGCYQLPGYIQLDPERIYQYRIERGRLKFMRVKALPRRNDEE